ncbi:MAG: hypothetical protein FJ146_19885 [Deltaproteobacteria bacterium]|nr:hypothetical protein [Deltaproteobacteria bacterium]
MRLDSARLQGIVAALSKVVGADNWRQSRTALLLYGSRTDDTKRGGDIDLLLLVPNDSLPQLKSKRRAMLVAIQKKIGECRVDLLLAPTDPALQSEFVKSIIRTAVQIFP